MAIKLLSKFKDKRILVIGDVMLDKYVWGKTERVSPEAPIVIVEVNKENYVPGGAANVANNISTLGGHAVLIGIVGKDEARKILETELKNRKIETHLIEDNRPTIQKVRIISQNQQLLRIDYEKKQYIEKHIESNIINFISKNKKFDAIVISDYAKGLVTRSLVEQLVEYANTNSIPLIVDPKPKHLDYYYGVSLITPNLKEASEMTSLEGEDDKDIEVMGKFLHEKIKSNIIITRGKKGMSLFESEKKVLHVPTKAKEVFDVSGAGDTVVAALSLALAVNAKLPDAVEIANHAAGLVVGKVGTSTLTLKELEMNMKNEF